MGTILNDPHHGKSQGLQNFGLLNWQMNAMPALAIADSSSLKVDGPIWEHRALRWESICHSKGWECSGVKPEVQGSFFNKKERFK